MTGITLNLDPITKLSSEKFWELSRVNQDVRLELTANGELVVMTPAGWESGKRNSNLNADLVFWNRQTKKGTVFDSSTGFILSNGAIKSPDVAWVQQERMDAIQPIPDGFLPLAPDFVIELRSATDSIKVLRDKMQEYIDNEVRLGWLINPQDKEVEIYRKGQAVEVLKLPTSLSGEDILPRFVLSLDGMF